MATKSYRDIEAPDDWIRDVRVYYGDLPEMNELTEGTEWSDEKIRLATQLYIHHFNNVPPKLREEFWEVDGFPSGMVLMMGVGIQMLTMAGVLESRNYLNFQDANVPIQINDKSSDYQRWIQQLVNEHNEAAKRIKIAQNAEEAFGFKTSPESFLPWYGG